MLVDPNSTDPPRVILEVLCGKLRGNRRVLRPGDSLRVGRTSRSDLALEHDRQMLGVHFELSYDGSECRVRTKSSQHGILLGGQEVQDEATVDHCGWIQAGESHFMLFFEGYTPPEDEDDESLDDETLALQASVLSSLTPALGSLYAVLDCARSARIYTLLREHVDPYRCLYEGAEAEYLAGVAPCVVRLVPDSPLLQRLVEEGWEHRWGIFVQSQQPLAKVRTHLRRFLMVDDGHGEQLYFRYFDPEVMRTFLAELSPRQHQQLFRMLDAIFIDDSEAGLLHFLAGEQTDAIRARAAAARNAQLPAHLPQGGR